jgi:hypothetical protein
MNPMVRGENAHNLPVSQWSQLGAFDSAAGCERARESTSKTAEKRGDKDTAMDFMMEIRCVPAESVYPPAK